MIKRTYALSALIIILLLLPADSFAGGRGGSNLNKKKQAVANVYRAPVGGNGKTKIWIVDGLIIRRDLFDEFLYGGNPERYPFVPKHEIWIDNAISAEEYEYTLAHELNEFNLMATKGMSYAQAHDSSLMIELKMRNKDNGESRAHEKSLRLVAPVDCDGVKEIASLPDSIALRNIYLQNIGLRGGISIWIVNGSEVRRSIFPDFGLSGNDLAYKFIPANEIWIDAQISCEETEFSIASELKERELIAKGSSYDDAYEAALVVVKKMRQAAYNASRKHPVITVPSILTRDVGTGKGSRNINGS
jgi:hypothetical protein